MILKCPECGSEMELRDSKYGLFYGCVAFPRCRATHGAHPDGKPLGTPADKATKEWRIKAHAAFDKLWKEKGWKRGKAYAWMRDTLGLAPNGAHIGLFDIKQCQALIWHCENYYAMV